jgi:hypothetical protein
VLYNEGKYYRLKGCGNMGEGFPTQPVYEEGFTQENA